jgi:hypothetical protein
MTVKRPPKKTETIEIRLPYAAKAAFMARCRADGLTASEAVRRFIDLELAARRPGLHRIRLTVVQALAAAVAGLAIGAVAAPSLAQTAPARPAFDQLDRDRDGALSFEEFRRR